VAFGKIYPDGTPRARAARPSLPWIDVLTRAAAVDARPRVRALAVVDRAATPDRLGGDSWASFGVRTVGDDPKSQH